MIKKESFGEYVDSEGLNSSTIKVGIEKSILHMHHRITHGYQKSTKSQTLGTMAHALILEPIDFAKKLAVWKGGYTQKNDFTMSKNSTAFKDFEKENATNYVIDPGMFALLDAIKTAVYSNVDARKILEDSQKEVSCYWEDLDYGKAKARFDILRHSHAVWDVKTCADIGRFERDIAKYGYYSQGGWYRNGSLVEFGEKQIYGLIVVETEAPHEVAVVPISDEYLNMGYSACRKIAIEYRRAQQSGIFPGVMSDVDEFHPPEWMMDDEVKL